jgi:hypothetical protein
MVKQTLTVALVKSVLQVLDHLGPSGRRHRRRRRPKHQGRGRTGHHRPEPEVTLDLDRLRQTGGDPRARPSRQASEQIPNRRIRVMQWPLSPSPSPPAY